MRSALVRFFSKLSPQGRPLNLPGLLVKEMTTTILIARILFSTVEC